MLIFRQKMSLQELNQGLNQDLPSLWKPNYTHTCAPKETKKSLRLWKNVNNLSDLQLTLGNVFFFLKTHTLHNKGGKKILCSCFGNPNLIIHCNWVNASLRRQTNLFWQLFSFFWTLPAWLCGWRCINSSVCATNAEVSKHSWLGDPNLHFLLNHL